MTNLVSLEAVHTHTHTHTILSKNVIVFALKIKNKPR